MSLHVLSCKAIMKASVEVEISHSREWSQKHQPRINDHISPHNLLFLWKIKLYLLWAIIVNEEVYAILQNYLCLSTKLSTC